MSHQLNDFADSPVPPSHANRSWLWLYMVEIGLMLCLPLLILGGLVAFSLPFPQAVAAIAVSSFIIGGLSVIISRIGAETHLTTVLILRQSFGTIGAKFISILILFSFLGWWGFQTEIMAQTFSAILVNEGWSIPRWLSVGVCGTIMITTSVLGSGAIGNVAYVLVPIKTIALLVLLLFTTNLSVTQILQFTPPNPIGFGQIIGILVGGVVIGIVGYPDLTRFLKSTRDATIASISIFSTMALIYLIAIIITISYNNPNIVDILPTLGFAPLTLAMVFFATWAANDKNLYAATIGVSAFAPRIGRATITAVAGIIGIILAYIGIFNNLVTILTLLGVATAPIAPAYILHYFQNPKSYKNFQYTQYIPANWTNLTSWAIGTLVGICTTPTTNLGLGLTTLTTAPAIDAFLATAVIILITNIFHKTTK